MLVPYYAIESNFVNGGPKKLMTWGVAPGSYIIPAIKLTESRKKNKLKYWRDNNFPG